MKLIVGLGNPGEKYARTRHNVGFIALDAYAKKHGLKWDEKKKFRAWIGEIGGDGDRLLLAKPTTFMNASGEAARKLVDFYNLGQHDVLVIHDDADMEFGKLRLVRGGNDGGHQGVASLHQHGIRDTWRLKVGVSNEDRIPGEAIDFVLKRFNASEKAKLPQLVAKAIQLIDSFAQEPIEPHTFGL